MRALSDIEVRWLQDGALDKDLSLSTPPVQPEELVTARGLARRGLLVVKEIDDWVEFDITEQGRLALRCHAALMATAAGVGG